MRLLRSNSPNDYWYYVTTIYDPDQSSPVVFDTKLTGNDFPEYIDVYETDKTKLKDLGFKYFFSNFYSHGEPAENVGVAYIVVADKCYPVFCNVSSKPRGVCSYEIPIHKKSVNIDDIGLKCHPSTFGHWFENFDLRSIEHEPLDKPDIFKDLYCHLVTCKDRQYLSVERVNLCDYGVQKILTPEQIYAEMSMCMTHMQNVEKETHSPEDIISRGFDKRISFRHRQE